MSGPIILIAPVDLSHGGASILRYRRLLADELGAYLETTVAGVSATADTTRIVLADEIRDDEAGHRLATGDDTYLYVRTGAQAGTQRRILREPETGYQGSRGAVLLSRPLSGPIAEGDVVEITSPLPVRRIGTVKGLVECVVEALARTPAIAKLTLTGADSDRISLEDAPYVRHDDQILGVYDRWYVDPTQSARRSTLPYRIDADGTTRDLVLGRVYTSSETVELTVVLAGDRLIYNGVSWVYMTDDIPPVPADDDHFSVPEHWITAFGMSGALRFLTRRVRRERGLPRDEKADIINDLMTERQRWARACLVLHEREFPRAPAVVGGRPLVSGTVSGYDGTPIESGAVWGWSW